MRLMLALVLLCLTLPVFAQTATFQDDVNEAQALRLFSVVLEESQAKEHIRRVREIASKTPYPASVMLRVSHRWLVWEWPSEQIFKALQACADAATAIHGDAEAYANLVLDLGNLRNKTKATYDTLTELEQTGLPIFQILGKMLGRNARETRTLSQQARLLAPRTAEALVQGFSESFRGLAEEEYRKRGKQ